MKQRAQSSGAVRAASATDAGGRRLTICDSPRTHTSVYSSSRPFGLRLCRRFRRNGFHRDHRFRDRPWKRLDFGPDRSRDPVYSDPVYSDDFHMLLTYPALRFFNSRLHHSNP